MTQKQEIHTYDAPEWTVTADPAADAVVIEPVLSGAGGIPVNPIQEIRAFHRFHFRLTLLYGGAAC